MDLEKAKEIVKNYKPITSGELFDLIDAQNEIGLKAYGYVYNKHTNSIFKMPMEIIPWSENYLRIFIDCGKCQRLLWMGSDDDEIVVPKQIFKHVEMFPTWKYMVKWFVDNMPNRINIVPNN